MNPKSKVKPLRASKKATIFKATIEGELPPWLLMDDDTGFGQLFSPVNDVAVSGQPLSRVDILRLLPETDRDELKQELRKGFHPILVVDLESGIAALEMRKYTPPTEIRPTPQQTKFWDAHWDSNEKYIAFRSAIITENEAHKQVMGNRQKARK